MSLAGKHIVLGISGGIAAYKSATLVRSLIKKGAEVQVVMTPNAKEFITPLTLSTLTQKPVVSEFFDRRDGSWHSHVALGLWADLLLIAPATAATIGKMVSGVADNMLLTTYLSMKAPVWIAPAMDLDMYQHPSTQANLQTLSARGVHILEAESGFLASGLEGKGRMMEPEKIADAVASYFEPKTSTQWQGKTLLITAGPTHEPIDDVRFVGNHSTGLMGYALAEAAAARGAEVHLVSGPTALATPPGVIRHDVVRAIEMLEVCQTLASQCHVAIFAAAVADYRPAEIFLGKLKRETQGDSLTLPLVKNPDIAATLGAEKRADQIMVGFALETSRNLDEARRKMERKGMDCMVLNSINDAGSGFATPTNSITIVPRTGEPTAYPLKSKRDVAEDILDYLSFHYLSL